MDQRVGGIVLSDAVPALLRLPNDIGSDGLALVPILRGGGVMKILFDTLVWQVGRLRRKGYTLERIRFTIDKALAFVEEGN